MRALNGLCRVTCCLLVGAAAQAASPGATDRMVALEPGAADFSAAQQTQHRYAHMLPTSAHRAHHDTARDLAGPRQLAAAADPPGVRAIGTLTFQGGPVMARAAQHDIYMLPRNGRCPTVAACWGNPEQFLTDMGQSGYVHVVDQYTGSSAAGRYPLGVSGSARYTIPAQPLVDADIQSIVHSMVVRDGGLAGYGHEYHVFLPPGQDECFDTTYSVCYSPDNPATFVFCAYHGSVDFTDVGHVIYSVEPWLDVGSGCEALLPDGSHASGQNSVLSHELIESITDPDGTAWWNASGNLDLFGFEIGDECQWITFDASGASWFLFDSVNLNGRQYLIQSEYNNQANGCTDGPLAGGG